ncbi:hypothetical protein [Micromonospora sp. LOL_024]|uniref:hypothetical protein n=1 Tax=Micromonospora sp. LOL_024 TaxID=3345412 RepID=UPI003A86B814
MPPVALACPLWWLARWAARLLTGFAVAAAFTLGASAAPTGSAGAAPAWANGPAEAAPAWAADAAPEQRTVARTVRPPVDTTSPPAFAGSGLAAPDDLTAPTTPIVLDAGECADLTGVPATPPLTAGRSGLRVLGKAGSGVVPAPAAVVAGTRAARAPPQA